MTSMLAFLIVTEITKILLIFYLAIIVTIENMETI